MEYDLAEARVGMPLDHAAREQLRVVDQLFGGGNSRARNVRAAWPQRRKNFVTAACRNPLSDDLVDRAAVLRADAVARVAFVARLRRTRSRELPHANAYAP